MIVDLGDIKGVALWWLDRLLPSPPQRAMQKFMLYFVEFTLRKEAYGVLPLQCFNC